MAAMGSGELNFFAVPGYSRVKIKKSFTINYELSYLYISEILVTLKINHQSVSADGQRAPFNFP